MAELRDLGALDVPPRHFVEAAAGMADPRTEGAQAFLAALLAPARSAFILLCCDLSRAADDLGMGLRTGERPFVMKALLSENPHRVLAWLGREARVRVVEHAVRLEGMGPIREHGVGRASDTADLPESLAAEADVGVPM